MNNRLIPKNYEVSLGCARIAWDIYKKTRKKLKALDTEREISDVLVLMYQMKEKALHCLQIARMYKTFRREK